ncbi:hypothetical protein ACFWC9_08740 [Streptomyces goshikiensis]|uniref:hypothetical protein n=1 Tax=Streptomyces goshikiensis TaxID=1942 RepID=UPI0036BB09B6
MLAVLGTALLAERRSGGLAVPLHAAAAADPRGALAALLERNEASAPGYGEDLNLAGALELTGTTVGAALTPEALLHTHRRLAVDDLTEVLVAAAHPRADELLAVLAEEEPSALCRAVDRWARDERPGRRVAAAAYGPATAPHVRTPGDGSSCAAPPRRCSPAPGMRPCTAAPSGCCSATPRSAPGTCPTPSSASATPSAAPGRPPPRWSRPCPYCPIRTRCSTPLRARADGEVLSTPALARRAGDLVRDHLADRPEDAAHAAAFVDRRLDHGPAAGPVVRPLVLDLLRSGPVAVRAALAAVLAAPGGDPAHTLRGELADVLLPEEADPRVLDAFLAAVAAGAAGRPEARTRELLRRIGRRLLRVPGGPAVFEHRTVEPARTDPAFGALVARWLADAAVEASALLGPGARRTVETLSRAAWDVT